MYMDFMPKFKKTHFEVIAGYLEKRISVQHKDQTMMLSNPPLGIGFLLTFFTDLPDKF